MKNNIPKILLTLFLLTNAVYAFDTLRGAGSSPKTIQEESYLDKTKHWYKNLIGKTQDKPINMQSNDVIIINSDRSITFNGHKLKFGTNEKEWIKVFGNNYRKSEYDDGYNWDDLGIGIALKRDNHTGKIVKERIISSFTIQMITYNEMFPMDRDNNISREKMGGVSQFYFKGLVQIEDGYLGRETSYDEFIKSDVGRRYTNTFSRPNKYHMSYNKEGTPFIRYKDEYAVQFNDIDLTHKRFIKRISIY